MALADARPPEEQRVAVLLDKAQRGQLGDDRGRLVARGDDDERDTTVADEGMSVLESRIKTVLSLANRGRIGP